MSIDGVGDMHNAVRNVKRGFDKANETITAMKALQKDYAFNFGISTTIFSQNLDDAENILQWARGEKLDIVFNMVRVTDAMLGNHDVADKIRPLGAEEARMRQFFLDRVRMDPLLDGQNYIYMHYADMIANGYHRLAPCPFQTQGIMLNPDGGMYYCENSDAIGNVRRRGSRGDLLPGRQSHAPGRGARPEVPDLPQPLPDERGGHQAGGAVRAVPRAGGDGEDAGHRRARTCRGGEVGRSAYRLSTIGVGTASDCARVPWGLVQGVPIVERR